MEPSVTARLHFFQVNQMELVHAYNFTLFVDY